MNKVIILGRICKDVDIKYTATNNVPVARFTIAVNRRKKGEADFITCQAWDKQAEFIAKFFQRGSMIAIVGRIQTGSYDKDGVKVYTTEVVVEECFFTGEKRSDSGQAEQTGFNFESSETGLPF